MFKWLESVLSQQPATNADVRYPKEYDWDERALEVLNAATESGLKMFDEDEAAEEGKTLSVEEYAKSLIVREPTRWTQIDFPIRGEISYHVGSPLAKGPKPVLYNEERWFFSTGEIDYVTRNHLGLREMYAPHPFDSKPDKVIVNGKAYEFPFGKGYEVFARLKVAMLRAAEEEK